MKKTWLNNAAAKSGLFYIIMVLFSCCLWSCGGSGNQKETPVTSGAAQREASGGALVREDPEGLISVSIVNGKGEMRLNIDKWDSLYSAFKNVSSEGHISGPFKIVTQQDCAIRDAWVGRIRDQSIFYSDVPSLVVVLLMDNGTIERAAVWPFRTSSEDDLVAWGPLPWLSDVSAISGKDRSVYAETAFGKSYDMSIPVALSDIGKRWWITDFPDAGESGYYGEINFLSENGISYEIRIDSGSAIRYSGYYEMVLTDSHSDGLPPNTLQLFMSPESAEGGDLLKALPGEITAAYSVEMDEYAENITLRRIKGDALFSHNGVDQDVYEFSSSVGIDSTIYPWELVELITGNWECFLEGFYGCRMDIFYSNFNHYTRDFAITFTDRQRGVEFLELRGGLSSGTDYTYGEFNTLVLDFYVPGMASETYLILDRGIHRGKRMMSLFLHYDTLNSTFSIMELSEKYDYAHVPLLFAKETAERREGRKRINANFNAVFWEYDHGTNTIWLTEAGLGGDEPACVSVEYRVLGIEDRMINEALPGMDCMIRTDAEGNVVEFILPMG